MNQEILHQSTKIKRKIFHDFSNNLIEDFNSFPKPRDGVIISVTPTHLFLKIEGKDLPVPFLLTTIRRVDIKEETNG